LGAEGEFAFGGEGAVGGGVNESAEVVAVKRYIVGGAQDFF
jgi:hypothetical protein